MMFCEDSDFRD